MSKPVATVKIRSYCATCSGWCPVVAEVKDGVFTGVAADRQHPLSCPLCPKGLAAPELVYNQQRLRYPVRRTHPKGDPDPGWQRISWDEALDEIAGKFNKIKAEFGPEAIAFARPGPGGSPMAELAFWIIRLANALGSPNSIATTNICQWHRDNCSSYTYARPEIYRANGKAEFEQSACIVIWGVNIHATRTALLPLIEKGMRKGAKLIVVDPRRIELAEMADLWLQLLPGTDGALILGMINVMLAEKLYDDDFVRDWTTAPFMVKTSTGEFLRANELTSQGDRTGYVMADAKSGELKAYVPGTQPAFAPSLMGTGTVTTASGEKTECKTVFQLLAEAVSGYRPEQVAKITNVPAENIVEAARMTATIRPSCWYSWVGIEQTTNASQTNRALCLLYALTGDYDVPGGNVIPPQLAMNPIVGREFLSPEADGKRLGFKERPLGPAGISARATQGFEVYRAILEGKPYPVKAVF
ncbi:MAG: molybdopterin-dependent oxidoreductase, partial [Chloroflexota bacterium]